MNNCHGAYPGFPGTYWRFIWETGHAFPIFSVMGFGPKIIKVWLNFVTVDSRSITGPTTSFTGFSGGNLVDGLPPACSFARKWSDVVGKYFLLKLWTIGPGLIPAFPGPSGQFLWKDGYAFPIFSALNFWTENNKMNRKGFSCSL